jgi:hypothetical protein
MSRPELVLRLLSSFNCRSNSGSKRLDTSSGRDIALFLKYKVQKKKAACFYIIG